MVLLSEKGAHGVSVRRENVCMLLPRRSQGGDTANHPMDVKPYRTDKGTQTPISEDKVKDDNNTNNYDNNKHDNNKVRYWQSRV